jgi:hypothetical protein
MQCIWRSWLSATGTCATNGGGEVECRLAAVADVRNAGSPVLSKYGTGHIHEMAPSAISPANSNAFFPSAFPYP